MVLCLVCDRQIAGIGWNRLMCDHGPQLWSSMSLLWRYVYGLLKPLTHWPPSEEGRGEERLPGLPYPGKWCDVSHISSDSPPGWFPQMQLFPSLAALLQWILGPQILLFILLANRILPQQFLGWSYSEMYSQGSCPFVCSGFIGDVIESGHNVRWVWRTPSFHSLSFHLGTPTICCYTESYLY